MCKPSVGGCGHTPAEHEAMKQPGVWETLRFIGFQPGGEGYSDVEMRNVPGTECTLTRTVVLTEQQREEARAFARELSLRTRARVAEALALAGVVHA